MALDDHGNLLQRSVACTLTDTVDGDFHLPGSIDYAGDGVGSGHAQVVVAMGRKDGTTFLQTIDVVHEIFDFLAILPGHAIACGVGDVDDGRSSLDNCIHNLGKIFVFGATGVFGIELHLIDLVAGIFDGSYRTLDNFFACRVELVLDVGIRCSDASMNPLVLGILQCVRSTVDVLLYGTGKGTDGGPRYGL